MKYPEKITRTIFSYSNLSLKFHVKMYNAKNEPLYSDFEYGDKLYAKIDNFAFMTLDVIGQTGWDASKSIMITQYNIFYIIQAFKRIIDNIYNSGIFASKPNGDVVIYADKANENTENVNIPGTNAVILFKPTIVYDENEVSYEGVTLYINKIENAVDLPIYYLEALYYALKQINLFEYSQLLMNYYVSYYGNSTKLFDNIEAQKANAPKKKINFLDGKTTSNFSRNEDNILSGINSNTVE